MKLGLRIDVDTFRGTRLGVPSLCDALDRHGVKGTFFFSVGPDNMGRHVWRLLKPAFLMKMLRSNAASLYGMDILLRGTFFPGAVIGKKLAEQIRQPSDDGHEIGLHAWDHHAWQASMEQMDGDTQFQHMEKGFNLIKEICGTPPTCSAAPGWKANETTLLQRDKFPFTYNSDCRGDQLFKPVVDGLILNQPQIPVNLPTYDEIIGSEGVTDETYNEHILSLLNPDGMNVLTIHAEVEGIARRELFDDFLAKAIERGIEIVPLGTLLPESGHLPPGRVIPRELPGREGWIAFADFE